jgi:hypothetical protein
MLEKSTAKNTPLAEKKVKSQACNGSQGDQATLCHSATTRFLACLAID